MDLFSGFAALIVGVAAAIGGLFTPVPAPNFIEHQFDKAFAAVDNITYNSSTNVSSGYSRVTSEVKKDVSTVSDDSDVAEKRDANLDKVNSSASVGVFGSYKLLPGGVYSYSYQNYVPDLTDATEKEMQSAYLYCLNNKIKSDDYIFDEKMPPLYDVDHPERYYGKVNAEEYTCVDAIRFVFASNDYCVAVKKLFSGANCGYIDAEATKRVNEEVRYMEEYDQKVAPVSDEGKKELLAGCVKYHHDLLVGAGDEDKWSEVVEAETCANNLASKFGDFSYCKIAAASYPGAECYSYLLKISPRVLPRTFQQWEDLEGLE